MQVKHSEGAREAHAEAEPGIDIERRPCSADAHMASAVCQEKVVESAAVVAQAVKQQTPASECAKPLKSTDSADNLDACASEQPRLAAPLLRRTLKDALKLEALMHSAIERVAKEHETTHCAVGTASLQQDLETLFGPTMLQIRASMCSMPQPPTHEISSHEAFSEANTPDLVSKMAAVQELARRARETRQAQASNFVNLVSRIEQFTVAKIQNRHDDKCDVEDFPSENAEAQKKLCDRYTAAMNRYSTAVADLQALNTATSTLNAKLKRAGKALDSSGLLSGKIDAAATLACSSINSDEQNILRTPRLVPLPSAGGTNDSQSRDLNRAELKRSRVDAAPSPDEKAVASMSPGRVVRRRIATALWVR